MNLNQLMEQHVWWRAGFGPPAAPLSAFAQQKPETVFQSLLKASEKKPDYFDLADPELKEMVNRSTMAMLKMRSLKPQEKKMIRKQSVQDIAGLNVRWLQEMTESPAQIREKMALFWHGHFATKTINIFYDQALLNTIREHALGNFGDLLFNVSKSASMIQFLNNNQNKKSHPNENFARELMELFTVGRGHFTESDVKESARAFTGWGATLRGEFEFRSGQHDGGNKTFFGKTGNFSGEDILRILLSQKQTAIFITRKIYRFFVNEIVDDEIVNTLADKFFKNGYDIRSLLTGIFTSSWFYDTKNVGTQIKSPVVWLVGMRRQLPMEIQNPLVLIVMERLLGQVLFAPPNVAGWPGGKRWIDSSSLMLRMQIPGIISRSDAISSNDMQFFRAEIFWNQYIKYFGEIPDTAIFASVRDRLLQKGLPMNENEMIRYIDGSSRASRIESLTIRLMGTPEYQLC